MWRRHVAQKIELEQTRQSGEHQSLASVSRTVLEFSRSFTAFCRKRKAQWHVYQHTDGAGDRSGMVFSLETVSHCCRKLPARLRLISSSLNGPNVAGWLLSWEQNREMLQSEIRKRAEILRSIFVSWSTDLRGFFFSLNRSIFHHMAQFREYSFLIHTDDEKTLTCWDSETPALSEVMCRRGLGSTSVGGAFRALRGSAQLRWTGPRWAVLRANARLFSAEANMNDGLFVSSHRFPLWRERREEKGLKNGEAFSNSCIRQVGHKIVRLDGWSWTGSGGGSLPQLNGSPDSLYICLALRP